MSAPALPTASETSPSATPFEQDIGAIFGDYSTGGESPEPDASAAGTTPAEPAPGTEPEVGSPAEPDAGAVATETPGDGTTPAAAPAADEDPFKDTTPAQYVVNGQSIPVEDIRVFKEGGAVIRPEALPNVLSKLAERDQLSERVRTRDAEYSTLSKVVEWTDSSGKTFSGADAAIENRIANASLFAENSLMLPVLQSEDLQPMLTTKQVFGPDGVAREVVVFRPEFLETLSEKARFQREQIDFSQRKHYASLIAETSKPQAAPIDYGQQVPTLVKQLATAANLDASLLSPDDHRILAEQLPFHTKDGLASVAWQNLAKRMMTDKAAQKASASSIASTAVDATKKGLANMAAAARGVKPNARPAAPAPRPITPTQERAQNEGDAFDALERAGAAALRSSR